MNKKLVLIIVIILIIAVIFIRKNKTSNIDVPNTIFANDVATSEVVVDEITFSNITKIYNEGITTINAEVTNNTDKIKTANVEISVLDSEGNQVTTMVQILENLQPGKAQKLATGILGDYTNEMYEIRISLISDKEIEQYNK